MAACSVETVAEKGARSSSSSSSTPSRYTYSEVKSDLFTFPATASLAHSESEDLRMGKGIAKKFKKKFGGVAELRMQGVL